MNKQPRRRKVFAVVLGAVALGVAIDRAPGLLALLTMGSLGVLFLVALQRYLRNDEAGEAEMARVHRWTMICFFSHLFFGLVVTYTPSALKYLGGDAMIYHTYATWILEFGHRSILGLERGKEGFYYTILGLYRVFGPHMTAGLALNATMSAAVIPLMTDSTRRLFGWDAARRIGPIFVLLPSVFLFTSQMLKEATVLFLFAVAISACVRMIDRASIGAGIVTATALAVLLTFRAPVALVGGAGLFLGIALGKRQVLKGVSTGLSTVAVLAVLITTVGLGYSGFNATLQRSSLQEANRQRYGLSYQSESGFGSDVDTGTTRQALKYLPFALTNFAFGPFPWRIHGVRQLPALVDVAVLWLLWPSLWEGLRAAYRTQGRRLALLVVPALLTATMLALSVGNYGVLMRERSQVMLLLLPILAYGLTLRAAKREQQRSHHAPVASPLPASLR